MAGDGTVSMLDHHAEGSQPLPQVKGRAYSTGGRLSAETVQDNTVSNLSVAMQQRAQIVEFGNSKLYFLGECPALLEKKIVYALFNQGCGPLKNSCLDLFPVCTCTKIECGKTNLDP